MSSDGYNYGSVTGGNVQLGGTGNMMSVGMAETPAREEARGRRGGGGAPEDALYAFADIVSYSRFDARLQEVSQGYLAKVLDDGISEARVSPEDVTWQDQGDARMMKFPASTDVGRVLAMMPRHVNAELLARNQDMVPRARLRIRLAFTMGVSAPGATGLVGSAPIAVARLVNWPPFRRAMTESGRAQVGLIIDDYLFGQFVNQRFRSDNDPGDFTRVRVTDSVKGFDAYAWVKLFGYVGKQAAPLLS
jgi:hypothetical protein